MTRPFDPRWRIKTDQLAALAVTLAPIFYFLPAIRNHLVLSPDDGVILMSRCALASPNVIHAGYVPLWNPYMFSGMPLFGAAQAGVLFRSTGFTSFSVYLSPRI